MKLARCAALLVAAVLALPGRASAQTDTARVATALGRVCPGAEIRVAVAPADTVRGSCGPLQDGRLVVRHMTDEWRIPLADIGGAWVRRRTTGSGARTGMAVGAIALGGFGFFLGNGLCGAASGCGNDHLKMAGLSAVLGALGGALIGSALGHGVQVWERRYP